MGRIWKAAVVSMLALGPVSSALAAGKLTAEQHKRVTKLLAGAAQMEQAGDSVKAWLYLREAVRLEQLWSANTLGEDGEAAQRMERYTATLIRKDDGGLMRVLHSKIVPLPDKLGLLKQLEDDVVLTYPGIQSDELLQGYQE